MQVVTSVRAVLIVLVLTFPALAIPISYAALIPGVPVQGVNQQTLGSVTNPVGAAYFSFSANAGESISVSVARLAGHFDPALWIYSGLFADTDDFGGFLDFTSPAFVAFGDDENAAHIAGPFGDPRALFLAPVTGSYSAIVVSFGSSGGPPNPFEITLGGGGDIEMPVPEPSTLALLGLGLAVLGMRRRLA